MRPALLALLLAGCGAVGEPSPDCSAPGAMVATRDGASLSCEAAQVGRRYIEAVAGRPLDARDRDRYLTLARDAWRADPAAFEAGLAAVGEALAALEALEGLEQSALRSHMVHAAERDQGPLHAWSGLDGLQRRVTAVWATDDAHRTALTEADIEAWIRYASLCREVQGGGALRISVADRVVVYRLLKERFAAGSEAEQVALGALGPWWRSVHDHWGSASYDRQQAWMAAAPLPPPMTATSLGYLEAVFEVSADRHVAALVDTLGPFRFDVPP